MTWGSIYTTIVFVFVLSTTVLSQVKLEIKLSDKHLKKVEKSKDARSKLASYKSYYSKDSLRAVKQAWRTYRKENKDSLKTIGKWDDIKNNKKEILLGTYQHNKSKKYTVDFENFESPTDSLDWALQELSRRGDFQVVQQIYEKHGQYDSTYLEQFHPDSIKIDSAKLAERFNAKKRVGSYLPEELRTESDLKVADQMKQGSMDEYGNIQKIDRSGVSDFFRNISPEEFSKSQLSLKAVKEKYTMVPDLGKEGEGIKRKSLEGTPIKDRLFLNGNITIQSADPLILDTNIQLGYRWTKSFSLGTGLILREQLTNGDSTSLTGDAHGISIFTSYDVIKDFFIYAEYQLLKNKSLFRETSTPISWQYAFLVGVGRHFDISRNVSLNVSLLYDFNYKSNTLNQKPLTPRIGYNIAF